MRGKRNEVEGWIWVPIILKSLGLPLTIRGMRGEGKEG